MCTPVGFNFKLNKKIIVLHICMFLKYMFRILKICSKYFDSAAL